MKKITYAVLLPIMLLSAISCFERDEDVDTNPTPEPEPPILACERVEISGDITEPTTWTAGKVYVLNDVNINVKSTLTIEPGTVVKLKDAAIYISGGKIVANGTAEKRIVFTSLNDDSVCGDTNADGSATDAQKGDWTYIRLTDANGSVFKYVDILYAGQNAGGYSNAVQIWQRSNLMFEFDHCTIAHTAHDNNSYNSGAAFYGSTYMIDNKITKFTNNIFYDNGKPLYVNTFYYVDPSNKFHNPDNPSENNEFNAIFLGGRVLDAVVTLAHTEVPYVLSEYVQVYNSAVINIKDDVILKFSTRGGGISRSRASNVMISDKAILTSYLDDNYGGDTNGDGNQTKPTKGDWEGIYDSTPSNQKWLTGPNILYAEKP